MVCLYAQKFAKGLDDEDNGDERGKAVFGEPRNVFDEGTEVEDHNQKDKASGPESDPASSRHKIPTVVSIAEERYA